MNTCLFDVLHNAANDHSFTIGHTIHVNFNGIKIGEVTSIKLDDPKRVVVITNVDKSAPIRKDSLVGLEFAGLTGVFFVPPNALTP